MQQLFMRRPNLDNLPDLPALPEGCALRDLREDDLESLAALMRLAFEDESWTAEKARKTFLEDKTVQRTFLIDYQGVPIATASARLLPEQFPGSGYVHWVAADPAHKGKRLGYIITLATLHEFVRMGCKDAVLETDDHRKPAIITYHRLGFVPEHRHETHPQRWQIILGELADMLAAANL
jgi:mycothiol synthase